MLMEYCDRGPLSRALERGKLKARGGDGSPQLVNLMRLAEPEPPDRPAYTRYCIGGLLGVALS